MLLVAECFGDVGEELIERLNGPSIEQDADGLVRLFASVLHDGDRTRSTLEKIERLFRLLGDRPFVLGGRGRRRRRRRQ